MTFSGVAKPVAFFLFFVLSLLFVFVFWEVKLIPFRQSWWMQRLRVTVAMDRVEFTVDGLFFFRIMEKSCWSEPLFHV